MALTYRHTCWMLLVLFIGIQLAYLHRVPGLMGDEASEGENVYELLTADHITITGERSYIGPFIDYVRIPFIAVFGYSALAVRIPVFLASIATFFLLAFLLKKLVGEEVALYGLVAFLFSPIYLTQTRLAWTISLFPFFAILMVYVAQFQKPWAPLVFGFVSGIALSNHIMFFPTLVAVCLAIIVPLLKTPKKIVRFWPAIIGFWAGFAMQFVILLTMKEDQGDAGAATSLIAQRWHDFPSLLPQILSGSSYIASYTGNELSPLSTQILTYGLLGLALISLGLVIKKKIVFVWWIGVAVQLALLMYMIDRYTLRYFEIPMLWIWLLAGLGLGYLLTFIPESYKHIKQWGAPVMALVLTMWFTSTGMLPFLRTGGSTEEFSLGNRTDSASALVDIRPLISCISDRGGVYSDVIHIYNRLQYISHSNSAIAFVPEEKKKEASFIVRYRLPKDMNNPRDGELCPELAHFRVLEYKK